MAAPGLPARKAPTASRPRTQCVPCRPQLPGSISGASNPNACISSAHPACIDPITTAQPVGDEGSTTSRKQKQKQKQKQKKKKIPNKASLANGDEKISEKPAPEEASHNAETQAEQLARELAWCVEQLELGLRMQRPTLKQTTHSAQVKPVCEAIRKKSGRVCRPRPTERAKAIPDVTDEEFMFNFF